MPPITTPQSSRTGLITAVVVFVILFVTAAIFAIYYDVQWNGEANRHKTDVDKLSRVVSVSDLSSPAINELINSRGRTVGSGVQTLISQRDTEAKLITGSTAAF